MGRVMQSPASIVFPTSSAIIHISCGLTVLDMADGTVLLHVDIETLRLEILSDHHARLNDAALLREILLAEVL